MDPPLVGVSTIWSDDVGGLFRSAAADGEALGARDGKKSGEKVDIRPFVGDRVDIEIAIGGRRAAQASFRNLTETECVPGPK